MAASQWLADAGILMRFWLLLAVPLVACGATDFERTVRPILTTHCERCHSAKTHTSGFSIATPDSVLRGGNRYGAAVVPGDPARSPLIRLVKGELSPRMPLDSTLGNPDIAAIEQWIASLPPVETARGDSGWPFRKPVKQEPSRVRNEAWVRNPIDAFVLAKLEAARIAPAPDAPRQTLARRVYFDLVGMPPTPSEMQAFLDDRSPDAYEKLIDRLLDDPRYGERWGRHWLDLVRYGETSGLEGDGAIGNAWRYRDWVIEAFHSDMPYDRFVTLQLAGADEHSKTRNNYQPDIQGHIPVAFLRLAPWDRSNLVAADVRQNYLNEVTSSTGSIFLGLTIGCARCHDHKYDPIPTRDFYRLQAFFNAIRVEDVDVPYADKAFAAKAEAMIREYEAQTTAGPVHKEMMEIEQRLLPVLIEARIAEAARRVSANAEDLRLEMRRPEQTLFSKAEIARYNKLQEDADRTQDPEEKQALDAFRAVLLARMNGNHDAARYRTLTVEDVRAELGKKSKILPAAGRERYHELKAQIDLINRRIARLRPRTLSITNVPGPPAGPDIAPVHVLRSGDYRQPGEAVEPGFPSAITGNSQPATLETDRYRQFPTRGVRMTLARWIASADNPLTARVMVNRIWQHHFGRGIVETPSDFGRNGARPTHPELLDWLALRFVEEKWSIKAMHRLMLTSHTYRQAAENPAVKDADDRLLWRFPRRRLEAEEIRDSILWISGRLNLERGGPSVFPPLPADLADFARYGREGGDMWEPNEREQDNRRRSVYTFQRRSLPQPMMLAFDAPVFSESCERRSVTTTALQALSMLNGDLVNEEATHLAERIANEAGADPKARIVRAFELVLNRQPKPEELDKFAGFTDSPAAVARVLLNSNEFLYVE
jgi:uncharacterized protein DUF1553/uncharacterized protein DUF1549/cytochrome c